MFNLVPLRSLNAVKQFVGNPVFVRTLKEEVSIKWNRPERLSKYVPERTGDLGTYEAPHPQTICLKYQHSDQLDDAEPNVRNQFTIGWHERKYTREIYEKTLMDSVKSHVYDYDSDAVKIAQLTAAIRFYQHGIISDEIHGRERRWNKYQIKIHAIDRIRMLKELRENDYRQFEWLLERLDMFYKPEPQAEDQIMIARKEGLRQLTQAHCDQLINQKLEAYKKVLQNEQLPFLENKIKNLESIRNEEIELKLEQTVTQEHIDRVKEQYEKLKIEVEAKKVAPTKRKWKVY